MRRAARKKNRLQDRPLDLSALLLFFAALAFGAVGLLLHPIAADPDSNVSPGVVWGAFCVFAFWLLSVLAWGAALARLFKLERPLAWLALGSAAAALTALTLGHLGLIGAGSGWLATALLIAGHGANLAAATVLAPPRVASSRAKTGPLGLFSALGLAALGLLAISILLKAFLPHGMSDELRYHLVGPRLWYEAGRIYFPPRIPLVFQCSYWEMLFLWGNMLLGAPGGKGLIEGQLFGQWCHVAVGFAGTAAALGALVRREAGTVWTCAVVAAGLAVFLQDTPAWISKNDWGIAFWSLFGVLLLWESENLWLAGFFLGLAVAGKLTALFIVLPLILAWCVSTWKAGGAGRARRLGQLAAGCALSCAPIWTRNALATGNPFFPALNSGWLDSPWLGPTWRAHQAFYEAAGLDLDLGHWLRKLSILISRAPLYPAALLVLLTRERVRSATLVAATALGFVFFGLKVLLGLGDWFRLFGPGCVLLGASAALGVASGAHRLFGPRHERESAAVACALTLLLCGWSTPWAIWRDIWRMPSPSLAIRERHIGGLAKAWLRMNAKPHELVVTTGDNQLYYLAPLDVGVISEDPRLDRLTLPLTDPKALLSALRASGARYLLDSRHWDSYYWSERARLIDAYIKKCPGAKAFTSPSANVIDLEKSCL